MSLLTTNDVAERLGVTVPRVHALIRAGRLPAEKMGRDYFIEESDLRLVADRPVGRPPKAQPGTRKRATAKRPRGTGAVTKRERAKK
jgi:excisionase family DNA binding protein